MKTIFYISRLSAITVLFPFFAQAKTVEYQGKAMADGKVSYIEKHRVEYDDSGKIISAKTRYESVDGSLLAELNSDFRTSLTVPDHTITDHRTGETQGLRRTNNQIVLFDQPKGSSEKTRALEGSEAEQRLLVGCQGLNYYLLENLESLDQDKVVPVRFLIPGKLDYYDFEMRMKTSPKADIAEFEIKIKNWFLKMFAPSLQVRYYRKQKQIVWYEGLSNIKNTNGENQKVTIEYNYQSEKSL